MKIVTLQKELDRADLQPFEHEIYSQSIFQRYEILWDQFWGVPSGGI